MRELIATDYDVINEVTPRDQVIEVPSPAAKTTSLRLVEDMRGRAGHGLYYPRIRGHVPRSANVPNTRFLKAFQLNAHLRRLLAWRCEE